MFVRSYGRRVQTSNRQAKKSEKSKVWGILGNIVRMEFLVFVFRGETTERTNEVEERNDTGSK